jgi:drug/metabolite transporter (DMT)-like permease
VTGPALGLVVAAAIFHALWNVLAKRARDPVVFLWSSVSLATLLLLPFAVAVLREGGFPPAALPFVVATVLIHALYFWALGSSYRSGDFSLVYPVARGLGVALVPVVALVVFDERPSGLGAAGIALVVLGIIALQAPWKGLPRRGPRSLALTPGTAWAFATGLLITTYSLIDKAGVTHLHPVPYIWLMGAGSVALLAPAALRRRAALALEWRLNWRTILVASALNLTGYLLVLFAFRLSKVGYVVAARELSIVFSAILGTLWLGEGHAGPRLAGAGVILAGVICVALAR